MTSVARRLAASASPQFKPCGMSRERDPLRERHVSGAVDRRGHAAHVGLPRVAAALASAAGVLFAAERATDFRAAGPGVHVGESAVATARTEEAFRFAQIVGEDRRAQSLRDAVV